MKPQIRRRKEINATKTKKKLKINKTENRLLENINKRDKPLDSPRIKRETQNQK